MVCSYDTDQARLKKCIVSANLCSGKVPLILLPFALDAIAGFSPIASFLLGCLVRVVLVDSLLRVEIAKPFSILLQ